MSNQDIKIYDKKFTELCVGLKVADCMKNEKQYEEDAEQTLIQLQSLSVSESLFCSFCKEKFIDVAEQRGHYKLDWHRENLKRKLVGQPLLSKTEFESKKVNGEISTSDDEAETEDLGKVEKAELKEHESDVDSSDSENETEISEKNQQLVLLATKHCQIFFQNDNGDLFSIYRCLLHQKKNAPEDDRRLVNMATEWQTNITCAVVLIGGGHFAAAIFKGADVLVHKTFHCYTVRAGQGGAQGARDNKGGAPKSAGASLRRYNESALVQHVQGIMSDWEKKLAACNVILYRASGPYNRQVLFGGKAPAMDKSDVRLRPIPFPTRRATYTEVKRVYEIITTVEVNKSYKFTTKTINLESTVKPNENERKSRPVSPKKCVINRAKSREVVERPLPTKHLSDTDDEIDKNDYDIKDEELDFSHLESFGDSIPKELKQQKKRKTKTRRKPKPKVNVKQEDFRQKIFAAVSVQDLELLRRSISSVLEEIKLTGEIVEMDLDDKDVYRWSMTDFVTILNEFVSDNNNTLLHIAAQSGHEGIINELLKNGLEPSKKNNDGKTAYCMTHNQDVRNIFKQFRILNPDKYNYSKSQIPEPISEDAAKERAEKQKLLRKAKREREKVKKQENYEKKIESDEKERYKNLSDREKRALAAERRILGTNPATNTIVLSRCFLCGIDITGKTPFEYNNNRFCTMTCLKAHRIQNPVIY